MRPLTRYGCGTADAVLRLLFYDSSFCYGCGTADAVLRLFFTIRRFAMDVEPLTRFSGFFTIRRFATDMRSCKFLFSFRFTLLIINYLCNLEKLNFYYDEKPEN